jgi:signal transduction histidine kinase
MTTLQQPPTLQLPPRVASRMDQFVGIIEAYQQATERLKVSHDQLMNEVARLRAELASTNEQLERRKRLAALGEMAAGVAHEIRNPLGSIQLYADLLARQLAAEPAKAQLAGKIGSAVRGLDAIISDMLTFTRLNEAKPQPTRFVDLLTEVAAEVAGKLESTGTALNAKQVDRNLLIDLDTRLFRRVLVNLIANASDAMAGSPADRREILVTAESLPPGSGEMRWRVSVMDNGPGISPDVLEKVFHPFFTTKDHGTGLGLAIVHHIIEAHGGTIAAGNRAEGGAAFTILLP